MERKEVVALLREFAANNLLDVSWVSIGKNTEHDFRLEMKTNLIDPIMKFAESRNFCVHLDKEKGLCIIYKP